MKNVIKIQSLIIIVLLALSLTSCSVRKVSKSNTTTQKDSVTTTKENTIETTNTTTTTTIDTTETEITEITEIVPIDSTKEATHIDESGKVTKIINAKIKTTKTKRFKAGKIKSDIVVENKKTVDKSNVSDVKNRVVEVKKDTERQNYFS